MRALFGKIAEEIDKVVLGQDEVISSILIGLATGGHVLLEGVPGTAKTLIAQAFARTLGLDFGRVQFTPDMLPSDITGTMTLRAGKLAFRPGPVFTNVLLADEINRTPPKTQAALLEAMQEGQVTVEGETHALPDPFLVVATQNPIEYEGTYPLPEAQLDRFVLKIDVEYPSEESEIAMLALDRRGIVPTTLNEVQAVATAREIAAARTEVDATLVTPEVAAYIAALVRQTRTLPSVMLGASPRAAVHLLAASKAMARFEDRDYVTPDDVVQIAASVLRHRLVLRPEAELERVTTNDAINAAINAVPVPR
jgi:MoxR-like ATPase